MLIFTLVSSSVTATCCHSYFMLMATLLIYYSYPDTKSVNCPDQRDQMSILLAIKTECFNELQYILQNVTEKRAYCKYRKDIVESCQFHFKIPKILCFSHIC